MTTEQEFFEAFGISKIDGHKCIPHNTIENKCEHVISGFTDCCSNCEHLEKFYPPITPEIVLGLEEIIIDKYDSTEVFKNAYTVWLDALHVSGKTREEALLELCIQLKDEIQDQVKALFNA